jgi:hypothetical protein
LKARLTERTPSTLPGTPDIAAEKRARVEETERANAKLIAQQQKSGLRGG